MSALTIVYVTNRKEHLFDWFAESLKRQLSGQQIQLVVVDFWLDEGRQIYYESLIPTSIELRCVEPLPSLVQGKYKITSKNYFSASCARNAGYVYAIHPYVVFVDDLTVLCDGWLNAVTEAASSGKTVTLGTYEKHREMKVENGLILSSVVDGVDSRYSRHMGDKSKAQSGEFFGCSFAHSLELALDTNGFDNLADISGYEDCLQGIRLQKAGADFVFDKRMKTIESQEHHFLEGNYFTRIDDEVSESEYFQVLAKFGLTKTLFNNISRFDQSHALLDITNQRGKEANWNFYKLRELRSKVEYGNQLSISDMNYPETHWFTGKHLSEY